jgi:hypothetical protein
MIEAGVQTSRLKLPVPGVIDRPRIAAGGANGRYVPRSTSSCSASMASSTPLRRSPNGVR